jgi:hypothetical protein|tara:strand:+ start:4109 stop:4507 length:399 start_codon:yes stop_codon:yes gene_type:complete
MYGKKKKYNMGGKLKGMPHSKGGIPIEAEGGEFMIKKDSVNPSTQATLEYINENGSLPMSNAMDRSQTSYMGGGMVKPMYKDGGKVTPAQKNTLKKHSKHHSSKHMNEMKKDMIKGDSFTKSHKKALKKVGK